MSRDQADTPAVVERLFPDYVDIYTGRGWRMLPSIDRVYVNTRAREALGWEPHHGFAWTLDRVRADEDPRRPLAPTLHEMSVERRDGIGGGVEIEHAVIATPWGDGAAHLHAAGHQCPGWGVREG